MKPRLGKVRYQKSEQPGAYDIMLFCDDEWFKIGYVFDKQVAEKTVRTLNKAFAAIIAEATA